MEPKKDYPIAVGVYKGGYTVTQVNGSGPPHQLKVAGKDVSSSHMHSPTQPLSSLHDGLQTKNNQGHIIKDIMTGKLEVKNPKPPDPISLNLNGSQENNNNYRDGEDLNYSNKTQVDEVNMGATHDTDMHMS
jgi:hypothetical protein